MIPPDPVLPTITFDGLLKVWHLIGTPIFAAVAYYVRDINKQLRAMNGRIIKLEAWTKAHEKIDDDRDKATMREFDQVHREIHGQHTSRGSGP